jgi:hypothetical protein
MMRLLRPARPVKDAAARTPLFTFTTSSSGPPQTVRCHHCGWRVRGPYGTFAAADTHICAAGPRAGLRPDGTSASAQVTAATAAAALRVFRFRFGNEDDLQAGIADALAPLPVEREVRLSPRDRVDHLLPGGVVIEVKVAGPADRVLAQLTRYAAHDRVTGLVLVTTRARHQDLPADLNGKPVEIVYLGGRSL